MLHRSLLNFDVTTILKAALILEIHKNNIKKTSNITLKIVGPLFIAIYESLSLIVNYKQHPKSS
jgi:hypothetical protein